jgi:hypothetical protein
MIKATRNADGTTTIHADEDTASRIWAHAWTVAKDPDAGKTTRRQAAEIANTLATEPGWILTEAEITG